MLFRQTGHVTAFINIRTPDPSSWKPEITTGHALKIAMDREEEAKAGLVSPQPFKSHSTCSYYYSGHHLCPPGVTPASETGEDEEPDTQVDREGPQMSNNKREKQRRREGMKSDTGACFGRLCSVFPCHSRDLQVHKCPPSIFQDGFNYRQEVIFK